MAQTMNDNDALLGSARALLHIVRIILWIGLTALLIAIPAVFWGRNEIAAELGIVSGGPTPVRAAGLLAVLLAMAIVMILLGARFIGRLLAIIGSVGEGDPFVRANATRLRDMAWITLALQIGGLALGGYLVWLDTIMPKLERDFDISLSGLIGALLLFILARVFERGAAMREELEGTV